MKLKEEQIGKALDLLEEASEVTEGVPPIHRGKVNRFLEVHIASPKTLVLVNEEVTAILILMVQQDSFSTYNMIKDLVFYSNTAGSGFRLLKEAEGWIEGWGSSVYASYLSTSTSSEKVDNMLERSGMSKIGSQFKFNTSEETGDKR